MRDTREVINKSEGAVVSVSIFLYRMVVQRERKANGTVGDMQEKRWEVIRMGIYINGT
jgi:hypothetical protein